MWDGSQTLMVSVVEEFSTSIIKSGGPNSNKSFLMHNGPKRLIYIHKNRFPKRCNEDKLIFWLCTAGSVAGLSETF